MATLLAFLCGMVAGAAILTAIIFLTREPSLVAGEDIPAGVAVYLGRDGKWYQSKPVPLGDIKDDRGSMLDE